ncbi:MAG TPA: hypothetical protein VK325_00370 [Pseudoxanthomonas sp.]|nr:hypothetical protein [Pseudoxanthomonas sp.]
MVNGHGSFEAQICTHPPRRLLWRGRASKVDWACVPLRIEDSDDIGRRGHRRFPATPRPAMVLGLSFNRPVAATHVLALK